MNLVEIATVAALPVSVIALVVVSYQTYVTRRALDLTRRSLGLTRESIEATKTSMDATTRSTELAIRTMQIEMLPSANWVIQVQVDLKEWSEDLDSVIELASAAEQDRNSESLHALARAGLRTPKGLIRRFDAEHTPGWLSTILFAGAQYYYNAKSAQAVLWEEVENKPRFEFVPDLILQCKESLTGLQQLRQMIDDVVPAAYLNSQASLNDERFLN